MGGGAELDRTKFDEQLHRTKHTYQTHVPNTNMDMDDIEIVGENGNCLQCHAKGRPFCVEEESDTETDDESSLVAAAGNQSWPDTDEEEVDDNIDFEDFSGTDTEDEEGGYELSDTEEEDDSSSSRPEPAV